LCPRKLQFCTDFSANTLHALPRSPGTLQCPSLQYLSSGRKSAGQTPESGHFRLFCPREGQFLTEFFVNIARALPRSPGALQCLSLRYLSGGRKSAVQMTQTGHFRLFFLHKEIIMPAQAAILHRFFCQHGTRLATLPRDPSVAFIAISDRR
jgi:hypothetical protein